MKKAYGIDLGTTYSCIAWVGPSGRPEVLPNCDGERTTPSAVWFDDDRVVVGQEAKGMAPVCPGDVATFVKREMGSDSFVFSCSKGDLRPEQVSAYILKKLVKDANEFTGENIRDVVITCPAYFSFREREATKAAGAIAGLNVLNLLNEPTAAAICYGLYGDSVRDTRHVLVYDLGGGTFDVTVIRVAPGGIDVVCTDGNHRLGGKDWDDRMVQLLIDKFQRATGNMDNLYDDPAAMQELSAMAERSKKALSQRTETTESFNYQGDRQRLSVTREEFETATRDLLEQTVDFTRLVMCQAKEKGVRHIDNLILVGGSTRMCQVPEILRSELGMEPKVYDPDESVAKGAAVHAMAYLVKQELGDGFSLEADGGEGGFSLETRERLEDLANEAGFSLEAMQGIMTPTTNVCSKSFGDVYYVERVGEERIINLIHRNTALPVEKSMTGYTRRDNQPGVPVMVAENMDDGSNPESCKDGIPLDECNILWKGSLDIQPGLSAGSPVETVFRLDESGLLHVLSRDPASGNEITAEVQTASTISREELQQMQRDMAQDTVE